MTGEGCRRARREELPGLPEPCRRRSFLILQKSCRTAGYFLGEQGTSLLRCFKVTEGVTSPARLARPAYCTSTGGATRQTSGLIPSDADDLSSTLGHQLPVERRHVPDVKDLDALKVFQDAVDDSQRQDHQTAPVG